MSIPANLGTLTGDWTGPNHLWLDPTQPAQTSPSNLSIQKTAQGQFLLLQYSWSFEETPQDGLLVLGQASGEGATVTWLDSFHTAERCMIFQEVADIPADAPADIPASSPAQVTVKGSYAAPEGPDWGWQIALAPQVDGTFKIIMHNISPEGEMFLAVEATYTRK